MKNNIKRLFMLFTVLSLFVTSLVPFNVSAVDNSSQIIKSGGNKTTSDGVYVSKTISKTDMENYFDIKLVVETKSEVSKITVPANDVAVVLVVDESNSMKKCLDSDDSCDVGSRRIDALKKALLGYTENGTFVKGFLDQFVDEASNARKHDSSVIRELGVVPFATHIRNVDYKELTNYNSTNFRTTFYNLFNSLSLATGGYGSTDEAATNPAIALKKAREMLEDSEADNKYIIFLTDGYPTRYYTRNNDGSYNSDTVKGNGGYYDDTAAYYARLEAELNKKAGIRTYSIGVGVDGQKTYENHKSGNNTISFAGKDSSVPDFEVGYENVGSEVTTYKFDLTSNSLRNMIGKEVVIVNGKEQTSEAMSVNNNNNVVGSNLSQNVNERNIWIIEQSGTNRYILKNKATGLYLGYNYDGNNNIRMVSSSSNAAKLSAKQGNNGSIVFSYTSSGGNTYNIRRRNGGAGWGLRTGYSSDLYLATIEKTYNSTDKKVTGPTQFKQWLGGAAKDGTKLTSRGIGYVTDSSSSAYYDVNDSDGLVEAYAAIFASIEREVQKISSAWTVNDPMNNNSDSITLPDTIEFVNFYKADGKTPLVDGRTPVLENENSLTDGIKDNAIKFSNDTISWNLRNSDYMSKSTSNGVTTYHYELNYRIRLKNEISGFVEKHEYETNGTTTLSYVLVTDGVAGDVKTVDFKIPSVEGYLVDLKFSKTSKLTGIVSAGNIFTLSHDSNCDCHKQLTYPNIANKTATSTTVTGNNVEFKNIPSGHTYVLEETTAATGFIKNSKKYYIHVDLDSITITDGTGSNANVIDNLNVKNSPVSKDLLVSKYVNATNTAGTFTFKITLTYNNKALSSIDDDYKNFTVKINGKESTLALNNKGEATFELKHNETATISGLPLGVSYVIEEANANGYYTEHCINDSNSCLSSTKAVEGTKTAISTINNKLNKVEFINNSSYELPETGSALMLLILSAASLLLGAPVIYMFYSFVRKNI